MTREEAIKLIEHISMVFIPTDQYGDYDDPEPYEQALTMAIEALLADTVSREMYDDVVQTIIKREKQFTNMVSVVRCKDCIYWLQHEQFGFDEDNDEYHDYCALLVPDDDYYAYTRKADDFCSYGERREK